MGHQHRQGRTPARRGVQLPDPGRLLRSLNSAEAGRTKHRRTKLRRAPPGHDQRAQATVELALLLPFLVLLLMCIVQTALVARDAVLVSHAARVGARIGAVEPSLGAVRAAVIEATPLNAARLVVSRTAHGNLVQVTVRYRSPTEVPLVGALVGDVTLTETASMPDERTT